MVLCLSILQKVVEISCVCACGRREGSSKAWTMAEGEIEVVVVAVVVVGFTVVH